LFLVIRIEAMVDLRAYWVLNFGHCDLFDICDL
jgi:hypothetical protein